jgi:hypothetical protein
MGHGSSWTSVSVTFCAPECSTTFRNDFLRDAIDAHGNITLNFRQLFRPAAGNRLAISHHLPDPEL